MLTNIKKLNIKKEQKVKLQYVEYVLTFQFLISTVIFFLSHSIAFFKSPSDMNKIFYLNKRTWSVSKISNHLLNHCVIENFSFQVVS